MERFFEAVLEEDLDLEYDDEFLGGDLDDDEDLSLPSGFFLLGVILGLSVFDGGVETSLCCSVFGPFFCDESVFFARITDACLDRDGDFDLDNDRDFDLDNDRDCECLGRDDDRDDERDNDLFFLRRSLSRSLLLPSSSDVCVARPFFCLRRGGIICYHITSPISNTPKKDANW